MTSNPNQILVDTDHNADAANAEGAINTTVESANLIIPTTNGEQRIGVSEASTSE